MSSRLTLTQDRLLLHAVELLKPGGTLVYAVCSLQEDEGAARIGSLLAPRQAPATRVPVEAGRAAGPARAPSRRQAISAPCPRCGRTAAGSTDSTSRASHCLDRQLTSTGR